jgi:hypothetical protein
MQYLVYITPQLTQSLVAELEICNNKYLTVGNETQLAEDTSGRWDGHTLTVQTPLCWN